MDEKICNKNYTIRNIERGEWNNLWKKIDKPNLLQSWEYGEAKAEADKWEPIRLIIETKERKPIAITQVMTKTLPILGGIARINRGPLLIGDKGEKDYLNKVINCLRAIKVKANKEHWWITFVAPEIYMKESHIVFVSCEEYKFRKNKIPWASAIINLSINEDQIKAQLSGKWRNLLRKAQKSDLSIEKVKDNKDSIKKVIDAYEEMKLQKNFAGISKNLLQQLATEKGPNWKFNIYIANNEKRNNENWAGMLVSTIHGNSATYLIAVTNEYGRETNANYLLLWQAIIEAKSENCMWFDLGGMNKNTPKGIAHFKKGLSGEEYELMGELMYTWKLKLS